MCSSQAEESASQLIFRSPKGSEPLPILVSRQRGRVGESGHYDQQPCDDYRNASSPS